ncbi:MAG: helix-turn-helix domain containing protein [Bdellovibrionales bacterium]|nr:helix-turn-helix domain containing protein [Bdellovibrionales bacterium]
MITGRPTKYRTEYCDEIIDFMSDGKSLTAFAAKLSVSKDTVYQWSKDHSDFSDALDIAKTKCEAFWEEAGLSGLFSEKGRSLNGRIWMFYMKSRFGWRDESSDPTNVQTIRLAYALPSKD